MPLLLQPLSCHARTPAILILSCPQTFQFLSYFLSLLIQSSLASLSCHAPLTSLSGQASAPPILILSCPHPSNPYPSNSYSVMPRALTVILSCFYPSRLHSLSRPLPFHFLSCHAPASFTYNPVMLLFLQNLFPIIHHPLLLLLSWPKPSASLILYFKPLPHLYTLYNLCVTPCTTSINLNSATFTI